MKKRYSSQLIKIVVGAAMVMALPAAYYAQEVLAADYAVTAAETANTVLYSLTGTDTLTVTSSGAIHATSSANAVEVDAAGTGVSINNSGTIDSAGAIAIYADSSATGTEITNQLGATIASFASDSVTSSGAAATASVSVSYATAIYMGDVTAGTTLSNAGTIAATLSADASATGTTYAGASATGDTAYGIDMEYVYGDFINSGTISANEILTAAAAASAGDADADASGSDAYGISMYDVYAGATFDNSGTISASISATATATASDSATAEADAKYAYGIEMEDLEGTMTNSGTISATLNADATASADNASANAFGESAYGIDMGDIEAGGSLTNSGVISASITSNATAIGISSATAEATGYTAYGIDMGTLYGTLDNSGTISASRTANATATADNASASVSAGYTIAGIYMDSIEAGGSLVNSGSISVSSNASAIANGTSLATAYVDTVSEAFGINMGWNDSLYGSLVNSGTISASNAGFAVATASAGSADATVGDVDIAYGINMGNVEAGGSLINSGTISASITASASASAVTDAYAYVDSAGSAYGIDLSNLYGTLTNSGTISASANSYASAIATGNASGEAHAHEVYGISMGSIEAGGSLGNSGTVSVSGASTVMATATDSASAYACLDTVLGIDMGGIYTNASLTNSGVISAIANSTASASGDSASASAHNGSESSGAIGLYMDGDIETEASLTNSGTISASALVSATADGVSTASADARANAAGVVVSGTLSGSLDNSGVISAAVSATAAASATTQTSTATANAVGIALDGVDANGVLTNSGTITAAAMASAGSMDAYASGIYVDDALDGTIINSGAITATGSINNQAFSIYAYTGVGEVINSGTMTGNIYLGAGGDEEEEAGSISLTNTGTISIPTLTPDYDNSNTFVSGDYTQNDGGMFKIGVVDDANYGNMVVGGSANLENDAKIRVNIDPNHTLAGGDTLVDVINAGTLVANGFALSDNALSVQFTGVQDENTVDLNVTGTGMNDSYRITLGSMGFDSATGLGALLDSFYNNGAPNSYFDELLYILGSSENKGEFANGIAQLLPNMSGNGSLATLANMRATNRIIQSRLGAASGLSSGDEAQRVSGFWLKPFGTWTDQDDADGAIGYENNSYGFLLGADTTVTGKLLMGASLGYTNSDVDSNGPADQNLDIKSYQLSVYGTYSLAEATDLNFQAGLGWSNYDGKRVMFGDRASSDFDGTNYHLGAGVGHAIKLSDKTTFIPSGRLDYASVDTDSYTESGSSPFNLSVGSDDVDELILLADGKLTYAFTDTTYLSGNLGVGYDFLADDVALTSSFVGVGGSSFKTTGIDPNPLLFRGGLGLNMTPTGNIEVTLRYDLEAREDFIDQTASLKLRMPF
ncbi:MAG: autotransporter outer membrane beta-barrel domain-containing protein [Pseudomonadota bacterium]